MLSRAAAGPSNASDAKFGVNMGAPEDRLALRPAASIIDFELVLSFRHWTSTSDSSSAAVTVGDVERETFGSKTGMTGGAFDSQAVLASMDLSDCEDDDFGRIVSSSEDLSRVLFLCKKVAGEFGRLFALRVCVFSSEVLEMFFARFVDSLGARLLADVSEAPVSRRPLGFAVV